MTWQIVLLTVLAYFALATVGALIVVAYFHRDDQRQSPRRVGAGKTPGPAGKPPARRRGDGVS